MNSQAKEELSQKCVVLLRNGAVFFSTVLIMRGILSGAECFMEHFGGYEPLYFLFLAGALILTAAFLFAGEILLRPRTDADPASEVVGPLMLLLFVLLPLDGSPILATLSVLTAGVALIRLPRFIPKCPRAVIMIGCAASGLPAAMFELLEPVFLLAAALFLLVLFPKKWRLPAAGLIVVMLAARMFLPVSLMGPVPGHEENKKDPVPPSETLRALYNLTLLACSEAAAVPQEYQCVTEDGGSIRSPARLALAILAENTGGQSPKQYVESDVLRRETLAAASGRPGNGGSENISASSAGNAPATQNIQATDPRIFLFDPGKPTNFRQNYRCTESFFQRVKKTLPEDAVIGFLLPEKPVALSAATLSAVRNTFPHTALFLFPTPMVLASSGRALSSDPEELDRRAVKGDVYEKLYSPYHILNLALPHFQEPVAVSSLLDAASRAKPNRTDRLIPFREPASKTEKYFSSLTGISLPLTGAVFALYFLLRYFTGWKRGRKSVYRSLEAGFLFAGSAFFLAAPFLRFAEPDPARWFTVCISVAALGTAWAFSYTKGPLSVKLIPRVILPLLALAGILYFEPHEVWGLFFAAMLTGPAWKNAFVSAAIPLAEEKGEHTVFPVSALMIGAALAVLLLPPLFFVPDGMLAAACLLAVILATRRPAILPA